MPPLPLPARSPGARPQSLRVRLGPSLEDADGWMELG